MSDESRSITVAGSRGDPPSPRARPMTSDEVLQVMVDVWRQRERVDPGVRYRIPITRNTNVERAANLLGLPRFEDDWVDIATYFKYLFRVEIDTEDWRAVLDPKERRTLGGVCDLIAQHALAPAMERDLAQGRLDWHAAADRAIRLILRDAGVDLHDPGPDSKLRPLLERHGSVFTWTIARLAPGRMPALETVNHSLRASVLVLAAAAGALILDGLLHERVLTALWRIGLVIGSLGVLLSFARPAKRYRLGGLHTLSDLAHALTSPPPDVPPPLPDGPDGPILWDDSQHPRAREWRGRAML